MPRLYTLFSLLFLWTVLGLASPIPTDRELTITLAATLAKTVAATNAVRAGYDTPKLIYWFGEVELANATIQAVLGNGTEGTWPADKKAIGAALNVRPIHPGTTAAIDTERMIQGEHFPVALTQALLDVNRALRRLEALVFEGIR